MSSFVSRRALAAALVVGATARSPPEQRAARPVLRQPLQLASSLERPGLSGDIGELPGRSARTPGDFMVHSVPYSRFEMNEVSDEPAKKPRRTMSKRKLTLNLLKNLIGAGVFALPAGVAAGTGVVPAAVLTLLVGAVSARMFFVLGEASSRLDCATYADLWAKTVGPGSAWMVDTIIVTMAFGACVQFTSTIVGLIVGLVGSRLPALISGHRPLALLTSLAMLPLCAAQSLDALRWSTGLGVSGVVYGAAFVMCRLFDGSYRQRPLRELTAVSSPLHVGWPTFALLGSLNTAFLAHFNVPRYWSELESEDIEDFRSATHWGFGVAAAIYVIVMLGGYLTFGEATKGMLTDLYTESDPGAVALRALTLVSVIGGYPLAFLALRDSMSSMLTRPETQRPRRPTGLPRPKPLTDHQTHRLTLALAAAVAVVACFATDVQMIISLRGALLGSLVVYVLPPMAAGMCDHMFIDATYFISAERWLLRRLYYLMLIIYGVSSSVIGTVVCALRAMGRIGAPYPTMPS